MSSPVLVARNRLNQLHTPGRNADPETIAAAHDNLNAAKLERAIRGAISAAPPLSTEQRVRLGHLLTSGGAQ